MDTNSVLARSKYFISYQHWRRRRHQHDKNAFETKGYHFFFFFLVKVIELQLHWITINRVQHL